MKADIHRSLGIDWLNTIVTGLVFVSGFQLKSVIEINRKCVKVNDHKC